MTSTVNSFSNKKLVLGLLPLLIIALIFGVYLSISLGVKSSTQINYSSFVGNSNATNYSSGLETLLSINSTYISPGEGILVNVTEFNTLSGFNNVSYSSNWLIQGLALGPCGPLGPVGIAIFQGNYVASNISFATPLSLYQPGFYACPMIIADENYTFEPTSDLALVYSASGLISQNPVPIMGTISASGYWVSSSFHSFEAGVYTAVGGDEWGQLVFLHFAVT